MSLMRAREFSRHDFARVHPGGVLGASLKTVRDVMQRDRLPLVQLGATVESSLITMATGGCGTAIVVDNQQNLQGIVTDGDLRRALSGRGDLLKACIDEVMTRDPITVGLDSMASEADLLMRRLRLNALIVVDEAGRVCGLVHIFR
jgi:arabinose-5-phosphate isomerase